MENEEKKKLNNKSNIKKSTKKSTSILKKKSTIKQPQEISIMDKLSKTRVLKLVQVIKKHKIIFRLQ